MHEVTERHDFLDVLDFIFGGFVAMAYGQGHQVACLLGTKELHSLQKLPQLNEEGIELLQQIYRQLYHRSNVSQSCTIGGVTWQALLKLPDLLSFLHVDF